MAKRLTQLESKLRSSKCTRNRQLYVIPSNRVIYFSFSYRLTVRVITFQSVAIEEPFICDCHLIWEKKKRRFQRVKPTEIDFKFKTNGEWMIPFMCEFVCLEITCSVADIEKEGHQEKQSTESPFSFVKVDHGKRRVHWLWPLWVRSVK